MKFHTQMELNINIEIERSNNSFALILIFIISYLQLIVILDKFMEKGLHRTAFGKFIFGWKNMVIIHMYRIFIVIAQIEQEQYMVIVLWNMLVINDRTIISIIVQISFLQPFRDSSPPTISVLFQLDPPICDI